MSIANIPVLENEITQVSSNPLLKAMLKNIERYGIDVKEYAGYTEDSSQQFSLTLGELLFQFGYVVDGDISGGTVTVTLGTAYKDKNYMVYVNNQGNLATSTVSYSAHTRNSQQGASSFVIESRLHTDTAGHTVVSDDDASQIVWFTVGAVPV